MNTDDARHDVTIKLAAADRLIAAADGRARSADAQAAILKSQLRSTEARHEAERLDLTRQIADLKRENDALREQITTANRAAGWRRRAEERAASRAGAAA